MLFWSEKNGHKYVWKNTKSDLTRLSRNPNKKSVLNWLEMFSCLCICNCHCSKQILQKFELHFWPCCSCSSLSYSTGISCISVTREELRGPAAHVPCLWYYSALLQPQNNSLHCSPLGDRGRKTEGRAGGRVGESERDRRWERETEGRAGEKAWRWERERQKEGQEWVRKTWSARERDSRKGWGEWQTEGRNKAGVKERDWRWERDRQKE